MKAHFSSNSQAQRGVALVIVLSMLVLMSAILVAFMGNVSTERAAQRAAYSGFEAQQAAESAINLVISQIRAATSSLGEDESWASQPGLIRTFGGNSRRNGKVYKLYSADRMIESQTSYKPDSIEESGMNPDNPLDEPKGMVDLNEPVITPGLKENTLEPHYPIVDPRAALDRNGQATSKPKVEGFWAPTGQRFVHKSGRSDSRGTPIQYLPMRVRWLYQLKDGRMVAADRSSGKIPGASKKNPPVARVAFWTDDESAKLNVNTAGENTFWDTPMASGYHESGSTTTPDIPPGPESAGLAASQPGKGEYQRFPGHPGTTNLSPALRWLYPQGMKEHEFKEAIYNLTPRYMGGIGSTMGGTRALDPDLAGFKDNFRLTKRDRLFASLDEFWFRPDRSPISSPGYMDVFGVSNNSADVDPYTVDKGGGNTNPVVTPQALEQLRFFITANSRASDLNLFGLPRVCMWPVHEYDNDNPLQSKRSGYDDLIAFTSTIADKPYYFTRAQPWSTEHDLRVSGRIAANNNPRESNYPGRNQALLFGMNGGGGDGYLQRLGKRRIPGVGQTFADKYRAANPSGGGYTEWERILLTIFDYVRTTNLIDTGRKGQSGGAGYPFAYTPGYSASEPPRYGRGDKPVIGSGQVAPSIIYGPGDIPIMKGFGRFVTLTELGLLFYRETAAISGFDPNLPAPGQNEQVVGIRCVLLPEMFTPSAYFPGMSEGYAYRIREISPMRISDPSAAGLSTNLDIAGVNGDINYIDVNPWEMQDGRFWMPTRAWVNHFWYRANGSKRVKGFAKGNGMAGGASYGNFPFYSKRVPVIIKQGQPAVFKLEAAKLEMEIYTLNVPLNQQLNPPGAHPVGKMVQRLTLSIPEMILPVPDTPAQSFRSRIAADPGSNGRAWLEAGDVIRSIEANGLLTPSSKGDFRHVAGLGDVPETFFAPSGAHGATPEYKRVDLKQLHNFRNSWGRPFDNLSSSYCRFGLLTPGSTRRSDKVAKVPAWLGSALLVDGSIGDFDRGVSKHLDGPFINKPDEGNIRFDLGDGDVPGGGHLPYYRGAGGYEETGATFFSPNRLVSSPVMFGSLPNGIFAQRPWETLQFCPPLSNGHFSASQSPPDHFLLDLFHMPVVEPYAISEPLSTAGKINLNSRLAPFGYVKMAGGGSGGRRSYIQRHTGIWGVVKGLRQFVIEDSVPNAGHPEGPLRDQSNKFRREVDPQHFTDRILDPALDDLQYFISPSEICDLDLPLKKEFDDEPGSDSYFLPTYKGMAARKAFWDQREMTGDNMRERLYSHIYPRLTTRSNVFTVHVLAQSIAKNPASKDDEWDEWDGGEDRILGEYRGSATIERYIDVQEEFLKNYDPVVQSNAKSLEPYYRYRIINQKRFNPQ